VSGVPAEVTAQAIMDDVLHDKEARLSSPTLNVEYRMPVG
jgi:hypothetical protein